jgi:hypothetical protein
MAALSDPSFGERELARRHPQAPAALPDRTATPTPAMSRDRIFRFCHTVHCDPVG